MSEKMTYEQTMEYIHAVNWRGSRPGLERITELLDRMGNPQKECKCIHVAGTNGKGSFCAMTESVLRSAGYKTGLFVSPFIEQFEERIQTSGKNIPKDDLADVISYIKSIADDMEDAPTEFELITAAGFEYFKRKKCDIVVLETGMGGRLDATNIITDPVMTVITGVALDHMAVLGDSVEKIAFEKAGIIKGGCPVLVGGENESVKAVIRSEAAAKGSPMYSVDYSKLAVNEKNLGGSRFDFGEYKDVKIRLSGLYQPRNAAAVLCGIDILRSRGIKIPDLAVREGLESTVWRARFEVLVTDPYVVYDGSHNPEGIHSACESIKYYFDGKKVLVLTGVMSDKDYSDMASEVSEVAEKVFTVTPDNPRSLDSKALAKVYREAGVDAEGYGTVLDGVFAAYSKAVKENIPLVMLGSLYLYGEAKAALLSVIDKKA